MKIKRNETVSEFFDAIVLAELKSYLKTMKYYVKHPPVNGCWYHDQDKDMKRIKKMVKALKMVIKEYTPG